MRLNWMLYSGNVLSTGDILGACHEFYNRNKVVADTVRVSYNDFSNFLNTLQAHVLRPLETGKKYGLFLPIPGGMVELLLMEEDGEAIAQNTAGSMICVESSAIDREFEKHVLDKE